MTLVLLVATAAAAFTWGARESHPAVVNSLFDEGEVISLDGDWEFAVKHPERPFRNGLWYRFHSAETWPNMRRMHVPGTWEAQGFGEPGESECWSATWDENRKPIRHKYMGAAWYRRYVTVPNAWRGKRVWIKLGGVRSVAWVWVNDRQVAYLDNYCATEKFEITDLAKFGETNKIVIQVDNRNPSRKGIFSAMHRWGGIYRSVELEATPETFIDDAWVRGDFDRHIAEVHVEIAGNGERRAGDGPGMRLRATVEGETKEVNFHCSPSPSAFAMEVPLCRFRPWSPECPNLYTAKVELVSASGTVLQTRCERFGVKKFEVVGREFRLNGRPFFVRGFGDDHIYPKSGLTPADRSVHRAYLGIAKRAGFNYVRLHTHCEVPEYFDAADELGIMVQAELPYYSDVPTENFSFDPKRDVTELHRHFRRYVSFSVYSMGNEGSFGAELDRLLHRYVKEMDPDRLKINQDSQALDNNTSECADFAGGPTRMWPRGSFERDRPFVAHEYLNLCVKCDSRDERKYDGCVWQPPATRERRAAWLARFGLTHGWGDLLQDAQNALQAYWQKRGVEAARADPNCDGYSFWTVCDVVVWNPRAEAYSAQGLFNPFREPKRRGWTPEGFARFNSPSCVLCDFDGTNTVFTSGDRISVTTWRVGENPTKPERRTFVAETVGCAMARDFELEIGGVTNSWPIWIFPRRERRHLDDVACDEGLLPKLSDRYLFSSAERAHVIISDGSGKARPGVRRIVLGEASGAPNVELGWWWMGNQVGTALRAHPALARLPHDGILSPLLFRILKTGEKLPIAGVGEDDLIIVGEGGENCFAYLYEKDGDVHVRGLDLLASYPEATAVLDGIIDYLRGRTDKNSARTSP